MTHDELIKKACSVHLAALRNPTLAAPGDRTIEGTRLAAMRAALSVVYEAMKIPTSEMIRATDGLISSPKSISYRAMIDASALKPGER